MELCESLNEIPIYILLELNVNLSKTGYTKFKGKNVKISVIRKFQPRHLILLKQLTSKSSGSHMRKTLGMGEKSPTLLKKDTLHKHPLRFSKYNKNKIFCIVLFDHEIEYI